MSGNLITIGVVTASAVLAFLLVQPAGTFSQQTLLILGAASVALTTISRFLPSQGTPVQVEVTKVPPVSDDDA